MTATARNLHDRFDSPDHGNADHAMAEQAAESRDYACLASVTHLRSGDASHLRLIAGVTGVIDGEDTADIQMIVTAGSQRAARRYCVELVADAVPEAVVTVPEVVDYDEALVDYLDRHGDWGTPAPDCGGYPSFDDAAVAAEVLDRA